jgi:hypothetical protein
MKCACGCGQEREEFDEYGRQRKFIRGHNARVNLPNVCGRTGDKNPMFGYHHTKEARENQSKKHMGENNPMFGRTGDKNPMFGRTGDKSPLFGKHPSEETRKKIRLSKIEEKNPAWKGGCYGYCHKKAKQLFYKNRCEVCNKNEEQEKIELGKLLSMHCVTFPKVYEWMHPSNWKTLCSKCHTRIEAKLLRQQNHPERIVNPEDRKNHSKTIIYYNGKNLAENENHTICVSGQYSA